MYYLQSRYYDPEIGRFISADGQINADVLGTNLFAYCENNPVNMYDPSGQRAVENDHRGTWVMVANSGKVVSGGRAQTSVLQSSVSINDFKNSDDTYSLYDNQRHSPSSIFHEQILAAKISKPSISLRDGTATLGSASVSIMTGGWETGFLDLSLLDIGHAKLAVGYQDGILDVTAMASAWSPSVTVEFWDVSVTISAHIGSIGGKINVGPGKFDIGAAYGIGADISIGW